MPVLNAEEPQVASISQLSPASAPPPAEGTALTLDYLYNRQPQQGTAGAALAALAGEAAQRARVSDALTLPGMDHAITHDEFEVFLGLPEIASSRIRDYGEQGNAIRKLLQQGDVDGAAAGLDTLAGFEDLDAGVSHELKHVVEGLLQAERNADDLSQTNDDLRKKIDQYSWNTDRLTQTGKKEAELTEETRKLEDARTQIKLNDTQAADGIHQARDAFATYLITLSSNHRHDQVVLAVDFYRALCRDASIPDAVSQSATDSLALSHQVDQEAEAYRHQAEKGRWYAAAVHLAAAFRDNPHAPALQGIPRAERERIHTCLRNLDGLQAALETRDFGGASAVLEKLKKDAPDFDTTEPLAMIASVKIQSQLHLGRAKLLAGSDDIGPVLAEFQAAAELWPGNPDLQALADTYFASQDVKARAQAEFDRLVQSGNNRSIYDRRAALAAALRGDPARQKQWSEAIDQTRQALVATETARKLASLGNLAGAWETMDLAVQGCPGDSQISRQLADLSQQGSPFATAIQKAREAEAHRDFGYSLTWYLNARALYPDSRIAAGGIERLTHLILAEALPARPESR